MIPLVIGTLSTVFIALLTTLGIMIGHGFNRLSNIEKEVTTVRKENHVLWMWARSLVDYSYRYRRPESPEPPTLEDTKQRQERQS